MVSPSLLIPLTLVTISHAFTLTVRIGNESEGNKQGGRDHDGSLRKLSALAHPRYSNPDRQSCFASCDFPVIRHSVARYSHDCDSTNNAPDHVMNVKAVDKNPVITMLRFRDRV